jgi:hypothetical protein
MRAIVAGTGFEGRDQIIKKYCREGRRVRLVREPDNPHDANAIAVYLLVPRLMFLRTQKMIGYIKAARASRLHKRLDKGEVPKAYVSSFYSPPDMEFPRVTLEIDFD